MVRAAVLALMGLSAAAGQGVFTATVKPAAGENIASPCRYELTLPTPRVAVRAVLAIFDRGREVQAFYNDPELFRYAERERLGLLFARHCRAAAGGDDMDPDPAKGLGRALFAAMDELAWASGHGELQSTKVIAFGFGASAVLASRMPAFNPERVAGAIAYCPDKEGATPVAQAAAAIPQLIIANSDDAEAGVEPARAYFRSRFDKGAPRVFAIQNGAPRRGALANIRPLLFAWLEPILDPTPQTAVVSLLAPSQRGGFWLYLRDGGAAQDPRVSKSGVKVPGGHYPAGWTASHKLANEWLAFEKQRRHPLDPKFQ